MRKLMVDHFMMEKQEDWGLGERKSADLFSFRSLFLGGVRHWKLTDFPTDIS